MKLNLNISDDSSPILMMMFLNYNRSVYGNKLKLRLALYQTEFEMEEILEQSPALGHLFIRLRFYSEPMAVHLNLSFLF